jgi:Domain of unknown function (DUF4278)
VKLSYRGIPYEYEPPTLDMTEGQEMGKYRGQAWAMRYPKHMNIPQPALNLKYRGIAYQTTIAGGIEAAPPSQAHNQASVRASVRASIRPVAHLDRELHTQLARVHQTHLLERLAHRLDVARSSGDVELIRALERESQQLAS